MKIKIVNKSYDEVMALPTPAHHKPQKMRFFFKNLIKILSATTMKGNHLSYTEHDMDRLEKEVQKTKNAISKTIPDGKKER